MSQCNQQYSLSIESQQTVFAPMGIWTWVVRFWRLTHQRTRPLTNFNVYIIVLRDFNPEENVSDKFKKINEIKDGRGLRKFIKEALNASAGKTSYDLLGSVEIPLKVRPILNRNGKNRLHWLCKVDLLIISTVCSCIFWPAFGCCTLQMLVKISIFMFFTGFAWFWCKMK